MNEPLHTLPLDPTYTSRFAELGRVLERLGVMTGPSECHGLIAGYLCGNKGFDTPDDLFSILDIPSSRPTNVDQDIATLEGLASETFDQLESEDCSFQPLLPEETEPLESRAAVLGEWCHGFLLGLGLSGFQEQPKCSPESHEFLQDLTAFTRVDKSPGVNEEEDERAFIEVVEYIRMGAILLREETLYGASSKP